MEKPTHNHKTKALFSLGAKVKYFYGPGVKIIEK
jgi:hypothetical protein